MGPTVRDEAIVFDELTSANDLPAGWTDEQDGGHYRLKRRDDAALFGYAVGPHSWKKFLFPPEVRLWSARRTGSSFAIEPESGEPPRYAFLGVRACDLAAIGVQDRVFLGTVADPIYQARREHVFIVAVNCSTAGGTCFCVSMNTGPRARAGFDLALTEVVDAGAHFFLVEAGSEAGAEIVEELAICSATAAELATADAVVARTAARMGRAMNADEARAVLGESWNHPHWEEVAARCLTCANCTMVCPTCFCATVTDTSDLTGEHAERWRRWDSCFTLDFTALSGGTVRASAKSRYRQWLTHKLATWHEQFGTSGCVGCGRCITWCPVGIDLTAEVRALCPPVFTPETHAHPP